MKLRKIIALMLVLLLLSGVHSCAFAEAKILDKWSISYGSILLNDVNNLLIVNDYSTDLYTLMRPDGTAITHEPYIYMDWDENMFIVALEKGVNNKGLIDAQGNLVVPMQYQTVHVLSDRWQLGAVYTEGNFLFSEFQGADGRFYRFGHYDVYYQGKLVGKLEGKSNYASAYGAYLLTSDGTYYDSNMTPSTYRRKGYGDGEYDITPNGTFHAGSGMQVGVPGCTLTSDDVKNDIVLVGKNIVDLQGNLYGTLTRDYDSIYGFKGDYAEVELNGKVGLIDCTGREVIPCEYDDLSGFEIFQHGYAAAIKDGMFGYLDQNGEVVCKFEYSVDEVNNRGSAPMTYVRNSDQTSSVLSAAAGGRIPKRYQEVCQDSLIDGCPLYAAMVNQKVGVFDMYGNEIIPANGVYTNIYAFQISCDGTVVVGSLEFGRDAVYVLSDAYSAQPIPRPTAQGAAPAVQTTAQPSAETTVQPATPTVQPASDGNWTCSCGNVNGGNFCPQCGNARPKELKCSKCGFTPKANSTPRFCESCGNPF